MIKKIILGAFFVIALVCSCKLYRCMLNLAPSNYRYLKIGQLAPDFCTEYVSEKNESPKKLKLSDFKGKKIILYFYPKDGTPFCKMQAKSFRDHHKAFKKLNYVILGISTDAIKDHNKAIKKYKIPFKLLLDRKHKIHSKYGAWNKNSPHRITFLIDEKGILSNIITEIKVRNHALQILDYEKHKNKKL